MIPILILIWLLFSEDFFLNSFFLLPLSLASEANMDHYLNLRSTSSDGTEVITMIRPGTQAGNLLSTFL